MSDEIPDNVTGLAEEYLVSTENADPDEDGADDYEEAQDELEYWEEQVEEFEDGSPMHEMAVEERDDWREKVEAIQSAGERREQLRKGFLNAVSTDFAPRDQWVDPTVLKALSLALTGERKEQVIVDGHVLPEDAGEISKRGMVSAAKTVHALAEDALSQNDRVSTAWDSLDTETRRSVTRVLARYDRALPSGAISDELGEEGTDNPGANIRNVRGELEIDPYHSTNDGYGLSLAGRYIWSEYGPDTTESSREGRADEMVKDGEEEVEDEQAELSPVVDSDRGGEKRDSEEETDLSDFDIKE